MNNRAALQDRTMPISPLSQKAAAHQRQIRNGRHIWIGFAAAFALLLSTLQPAPAAEKESAYLPAGTPEPLMDGWRLYIDHGKTAEAQKKFEESATGAPSFLALSSLSQMHIQQARYTDAATALIRALDAAPWDAYGEPAIRDLMTLLPYLPAQAQKGPSRAAVRASLEKRAQQPQVGWIERECLRELLDNVLWLDGDLPAYHALRAAQNFAPQWLLAGPFSNRNREGFSAEQEIEKTIPALDLQKNWNGRGRQVGWFVQPTPHTGRLLLDRIFYPGSEGLFYACVFLESKEAMPATLAIDVCGASACWLNGAAVYSDGVYCRNNGRLQRLIGVSLRKGLNQLVFKVAGDLKCTAQLSLRAVALPVAELNKPGSAAQAESRAALLSFQATPEAQSAWQAAPASPSAASETSKPAFPENNRVAKRLRSITGDPGIFWGALAEFAARADKAGADPLATLNVAYLLRERGLSDADFSRERPYYEELARKFSACPLFLASAAFSQPDENRTRQMLEKALAAGPQERNIADDLLRMMGKGGFYDQALARSRELVKDRPTYDALNAGALVLQKRDWDEEALQQLLAARDFLPSSGDLSIRISRLVPQGKERMAELERFLKTGADPATEAALAAGQYRAGAYPAATENYLRLARKIVYNETYWDAAAAGRIAQGDYPGAAECLQEGLRWMPQSPILLEKIGRILLCANKREDGLAFLDRSLEVKKDNPLLQAYRTELLPKEKTFYARVEIPFSELAGREVKSSDFPDFDSVILLDQAFIRVNANGTARRMYRSVVKVLRQRGADEASRTQIFYTPGSQRVSVVRARVWQPDGSQNDNAQTNDRDFGEDGSPAMMYGSGGRVRQISLPQVREGSIVDFQWTVEDSGEQLYHNEFSDTYFFGGMEPAVRFRYTVEYPEGMPLHHAVANAAYQPRKSVQDGIACLDWEERDIPGIKPEPGMPPYSEIKAQLGVSTFRDWNALGSWAWNLFAPQMELSAEMKQKVAELTANAKTREDKTRAIYDFVVDEIRYVSISYGRFGYVPHKVERTFSSRYGDCKDTAALFVALLKEAGVEANPVLVRSREKGKEPLGLPSSDNYDHSIAYVPANGPDDKHYWLDGTVDYHPFGMIPFMDRDTRALVFGPGKGQELVIDPAIPEQSVDKTRMTLRMAPGGAGELAFRAVERGEGAVDFMSLLEKPDALKYMLSSVAQDRYPGSTVSDMECSPPGKVEEIFFSFKIKSPTLARKNAGEYRLRASFFTLQLSQLTTLPARKYDLVLGQPRISAKTARILLPSGGKFKTIPADLSLQTPAASFTRTAVEKDGKLELITILTIRAERVKPAEYPEFKKFCNAVTAAMEESIVYTEDVTPNTPEKNESAPQPATAQKNPRHGATESEKEEASR